MAQAEEPQEIMAYANSVFDNRKLKGSAKTGKCIFPFMHHKKVHNKCDKTSNGAYYCPTGIRTSKTGKTGKFDDDGVLHKPWYYGHCDIPGQEYPFKRGKKIRQLSSAAAMVPLPSALARAVAPSAPAPSAPASSAPARAVPLTAAPAKIIAYPNDPSLGNKRMGRRDVKGGECIFPFKHNRIVYTKCAKDNFGYYCPTGIRTETKKGKVKSGKYDKNGVLEKPWFYGYCDIPEQKYPFE